LSPSVQSNPSDRDMQAQDRGLPSNPGYGMHVLARARGRLAGRGCRLSYGTGERAIDTDLCILLVGCCWIVQDIGGIGRRSIKEPLLRTEQTAFCETVAPCKAAALMSCTSLSRATRPTEIAPLSRKRKVTWYVDGALNSARYTNGGVLGLTTTSELVMRNLTGFYMQ
jgi:hypothetical protein